MFEVVHSKINPGVAHIIGFYKSNYLTDAEFKKNGEAELQKKVEANKNRLIQVTIIPEQIKDGAWILPFLYELGFDPVYTHKNPNSVSIVRMFLRRPDFEEQERVEVKWTPAEPISFSGFSKVGYHQGGCCGWTEAIGPYYVQTNDYRYEDESLSMKDVALLLGEMKLYWRNGQAFQMFLPRQVWNSNNYIMPLALQCMTNPKKGAFKKEYSYYCPTNKCDMDLYISCSNVKKKETWESLSKEFNFPLTKEDPGITKEEEVGPVRDANGRFARKGLQVEGTTNTTWGGFNIDLARAS